jgi:hypothetical protein
MNPYVKDEEIHSPMLDRFMELGVKGGQNSDGSQKNGFLKYEKGKPVGIYDPDSRTYVPIAELASKCDALLGAPPGSLVPWKSAVGNPDKDTVFRKYFSELKTMNTLGATLARAYAKHSKDIGMKLVETQVAYNEKDVNTVLLTGFFHAYGPINDYLN